MSDRKSNLGLGVVLGVIVGALGGIFLAPKSGKENRKALAKKMEEMKEMMESGEMQKRVNEIFGNITDESMQLYAQARADIMDRLEKLQNMDGDDYAKLVNDVVQQLKDKAQLSGDKFYKLKESFIKDWPEMREEAKHKVKKTAKKTL